MIKITKNRKIKIIANILPGEWSRKEGQQVVHSLNQLYEKAEREYNAFGPNWDWFAAQQEKDPPHDEWAEVWVRIDQN